MEQPSTPRQQRAVRTRCLIIEAAARQFAEHGFDGVSLNDLVLASDVSKGAFYFHFASKQEVALAAFRAKQEELIARLLAGSSPGGSVMDQVVSLMVRRAQLVRDDPSLRCVIRLGSELNVRSGSGSQYASFHDLAVDLIADLVAQGQRAGEFRRELDPGATARAIFAWIVGVDTLSLLASHGQDLEDRTAAVLDLLVPALRAPAGGGAGPGPRRRPQSAPAGPKRDPELGEER
jgi:AcrR family transcriptional regulator